jgi:hypothetical protein
MIVVKSAQEMADRVLDLRRGAGDRLVNRICVVGDGDRLMAVDPSFHHAADPIGAALSAGLVAEVDLDARDLMREAMQCRLDDGVDVRAERFDARNIVIRVELDLHSSIPEDTNLSLHD